MVFSVNALFLEEKKSFREFYLGASCGAVQQVFFAGGGWFVHVDLC